MQAIQTRLDEEDGTEARRMIDALYKEEDQVKYLLEQYPGARGHYTALYILYCFKFQRELINIKLPKFSNLFEMTSPESITRLARLVQTKHPELKPTEPRSRKRRRREAYVREYVKNV